MSDWKQRVVTERDELIVKMEKLKDFLRRNNSHADYKILDKQLSIMHQYVEILNDRISRFIDLGEV